jgi:serine/threonine protein kinase
MAERSTTEGPFLFLRPSLISHTAQSQVIECEAHDKSHGDRQGCILKFFSPRAESALKQELAVYTKVKGDEELGGFVPRLLWSGTWPSQSYRSFIGRFPSLLRKSDRSVRLIAIELIINAIQNFPASEPPELHVYAIKTALHALQLLHSNGIVHGDISVDNIIFRREAEFYDAFWIDFSSAIIDASPEDVAYEWQKAVQYFSHLVTPPL